MNLLYEKVKDSVSPIKKKSLKKMINELDKIAHLDNHKKIYALNVNQISYNKKEIVKKSWSEKKKQDKNNLIEDTNYDSESDNNNKYIDSDSDTESKDSFYYLTEEDSESELENNNEDD
jgi:predicted Zn-dependent protease